MLLSLCCSEEVRLLSYYSTALFLFIIIVISSRMSILIFSLMRYYSLSSSAVACTLNRCYLQSVSSVFNISMICLLSNNYCFSIVFSFIIYRLMASSCWLRSNYGNNVNDCLFPLKVTESNLSFDSLECVLDYPTKSVFLKLGLNSVFIASFRSYW